MSHDDNQPEHNPIAAPSEALPMPVYEYQKLENGFGSATAPSYGDKPQPGIESEETE